MEITQMLFVSKTKYIELWKFCKNVQLDNNTLMQENRKLRNENMELREKLHIKEFCNEK